MVIIQNISWGWTTLRIIIFFRRRSESDEEEEHERNKNNVKATTDSVISKGDVIMKRRKEKMDEKRICRKKSCKSRQAEQLKSCVIFRWKCGNHSKHKLKMNSLKNYNFFRRRRESEEEDDVKETTTTMSRWQQTVVMSKEKIDEKSYEDRNLQIKASTST